MSTNLPLGYILIFKIYHKFYQAYQHAYLANGNIIIGVLNYLPSHQ